MKVHRTKKGTELPLEDLDGDQYLKVQYRIVWFREEYPQGTIESTPLEISKDHAIFTASIFIPNEKGEMLKLANATKRVDYAQDVNFLECAETGAIGRALALCGYGTQFTGELNEKKNIADSPVRKPSPPTPQVNNVTRVQPRKPFQRG